MKPPFTPAAPSPRCAWPRTRGIAATPNACRWPTRRTPSGATAPSSCRAGRDQRVPARKWARELDYRLIKEIWAFGENRIAVRFAYEWHDDSGQWFRSYGNENWEFDAAGLMRRRFASINDLPIAEQRTQVPLERPRRAAAESSKPERSGPVSLAGRAAREAPALRGLPERALEQHQQAAQAFSPAPGCRPESPADTSRAWCRRRPRSPQAASPGQRPHAARSSLPAASDRRSRRSRTGSAPSSSARVDADCQVCQSPGLPRERSRPRPRARARRRRFAS